MNSRIKVIVAAGISFAALSMDVVAASGPSTSTTPYLLPAGPDVEFTPILAVGDEARHWRKGDETYRMVGIPDGLGVIDNGDSITVLMNHELSADKGIVRAHGGKGAFVSRWHINKSDLRVLQGEDQISKVKLWNGTAYNESTVATFNRFCSADLPAPTAFFNSSSGKGFAGGRIFMNGEEADGGRAFAHLVQGREHGTTYELPALGKAAWENLVASPYEQDKTIVAGLDDGDRNASKLYFYIGEKQRNGSPIQLAGLSNGKSWQVAIEGYATEGDKGATGAIPIGFSGNFTLVENGGTGLNRVEDGAWDPLNPNRFYFVTTDWFDAGASNSRLWRATFDDIARPENGGTIEVLIDGEDEVKMMDNMTVDSAGSVYIQEDVGNKSHLGKIWKYDPASDSLTLLAGHDGARFLAGASGFLTQDEESSGIVEVTEMFQGVTGYDTQNNRYFLLDVQAHYTINAANPHGFANADELVQGGQLLMMKVSK